MVYLFAFLSILGVCFCGVLDHVKKIELKMGCSSIEEIDYIYMINLDHRPERWNRALRKLALFKIFPERFSAIYGWTLPIAVLNDISLKFEKWMWVSEDVAMYFPFDREGNSALLFLDQRAYGQSIFSKWTVKGTIGCSLSHFSVLKDAFDSAYRTIWIMEDDIEVLKDPHELTPLISELDAIDSSWDVLYTDCDFLVVSPDRDLKQQIPWMWRPDMPFLDLQPLTRHFFVSDHLIRIGSRMRAHSMIYSRRGIEKILSFYASHGNFLPYDTEIALIPNIRMYVVKDSIVTFCETESDTRCRHF